MVISRVLIVGLGSIGERHLRLARQLLPEADIRVLRHRKTERVPLGANGVYSQINEAVLFSPQIAVIASPAPFHVAAATELACVGVHLLIEKPISATIQGVMGLLEICKRKRVNVLTGYNLRFLPSLQRFRECLMQGLIGEVLSVRCEAGQYLPLWRPQSDYRETVSARKDLGGGVLLELSHELDYLRWIFGEVDWVQATLSRQSQLDIDVEDSAHLLIGIKAKMSGRNIAASVDLDFIRHDTTRICNAIGEQGTLRWDGVRGEISLYAANSKEWDVIYSREVQRDHTYLAEWQNFIGCVEQKSEPLVSGLDGMKVLEVIEAARLSAANGQKILVKYCHQMESLTK